LRTAIAWLLLCVGWQCAAANLTPVTIALPGPGNLPYLPVELMAKIGADKAEGLQVTLRHFSGGPLALKDMMAGNSDFVSLGFSALAETKDIQGKVYSLAAMTRVPAFTLLVSTTLKGKIKNVADLRGRSIGIPTSSKAGKSVGQQLTEFLLKRANVSPEDVNFISSGMNQQQHAATLQSGSVDAIITNEPSATKLEAAGIAYRLVDLHDPVTTRKYFGGLVLYTQLASRADVIRDQPEKAKRVVAALIRTLDWMRQHNAKEIGDHIAIGGPDEYASFVRALEKNKDMFSPDGAFSAEQLRGTDALLKVLSGDKNPTAPLDRFINDQWVGRQP
jgi:NitT/TauT family transport system substrate-binding protein